VPGGSKAVFLSYASEDSEAVRRIAHALQGAGIEVWFDQSELRGGDAWDQKIRQQIRDCQLFLPVISVRTEQRLEGYFRREWKLACDRTDDMASEVPFLVPLLIDDTPNASAHVPEKFRHVQWTRLAHGNATPEFVALIKMLLTPGAMADGRATIERTSGRPAPLTQPPVSNASARPAVRRSVALVAVGVIAIAAATFVAITRFNERSAQTTPATPALPAVTNRSIAVLPFVDLSERHDQEYFADGMAEEISDLLSRIPNLDVIGRTSAFQFKSHSEDLRSIGKKLGAANIVEGSVRKADTRIRVTAQLVDAATGARRWSESYDRDFGDVLLMQDEIATSIARALQVAVDADSSRTPRPLQNAEAYRHYLRGRSAYDRLDREGMLDARTEFEQALALDPSFLRAAESLALTHAQTALNQLEPSGPAWKRAQDAAEQALRIDANSAPAHAVMALRYAENEYDWAAADAEMRKALASNPHNSDILDFAARLALHRGLTAEALRNIDASLALDPLNPYAFNTKGMILFLAGDFSRAELALRKSIAISASFWGNHAVLAWLLLEQGRSEAALKEAEAETSDGGRRVGLAMSYYAMGRKKESDALLAGLAKDASTPEGALPMGPAMVYAYRGQTDQAFAWLEAAYVKRDPDILLWLRNCPVTASLRSDPRYKTYLSKLNLPE
jgi:TolB-like protein